MVKTPPNPAEAANGAPVAQDNSALMRSARDPHQLFAAWFARACEEESADPNAASLATVDEQGLPDVRIVLLKGIMLLKGNESGRYRFFTNLHSKKAADLRATAHAAICFHWKSLALQIRMRGSVEQLSSAEADAYFRTRAYGSRLGAWASRQSESMPDPDDLQRRLAKQEAHFAGKDIPRPSFWGGYALLPTRMEFWAQGRHRLHERIAFNRAAAGRIWEREWLYP